MNITENYYAKIACYTLGTLFIAALFNRIIQCCFGANPKAKTQKLNDSVGVANASNICDRLVDEERLRQVAKIYDYLLKEKDIRQF